MTLGKDRGNQSFNAVHKMANYVSVDDSLLAARCALAMEGNDIAFLKEELGLDDPKLDDAMHVLGIPSDTPKESLVPAMLDSLSAAGARIIDNRGHYIDCPNVETSIPVKCCAVCFERPMGEQYALRRAVVRICHSVRVIRECVETGGARKWCPSNTYTQRERAKSRSHSPGWDVRKYIQLGAVASVSARVNRAFNAAKSALVRNDKELKNTSGITLDEALQARYLVKPRLKEGGIFSEMPVGKDSKMMLEYYEKGRYLEEITYERAEHLHKNGNTHHPDALDRVQTWQETYETMLDLLSSALRLVRGKTILDAYDLMWTWVYSLDVGFAVANAKFKNLNPAGVLAFLAMVDRLGLSNKHTQTVGERSFFYRSLEVDKEVCANQIKAYLKKEGPQPELLKYYLLELHDHTSLVNGELRRIRAPCKHDADKYRPNMACAYALHWSRDKAQPTMMGMSSVLMGAGLKNALTGMLSEKETRADLSKLLHESLGPQISQVSDLLNTATATAGQSQAAVHNVTLSADKIGALAEEIHSKVTPLVASVNPVLEGLGGLADSIQHLIGKMSAFVPNVTLFQGAPSEWFTNINTGDILWLLTLYSLYCNSTSKTIRITLGLAMLKHLGILSKVIEAGQWVWDQLKEMAQPCADEREPESWMEMLAHIFKEPSIKKASFLAGLLVCILCGIKLPGRTCTKLGKAIMECLKNLHLVGLGFLGASRVFQYIHAAFTVCFEWIKEHVFGVTSESKKVGVEIAKWAARVRFFSSEEGVRLMRVSKKALEEASQLYPRRVEFEARMLADPNWATRDQQIFIKTLHKDVLAIQNATFRIKTHCCFKHTMFHVQLVGRHGIGKSTLTSALVSHMKQDLFPSMPNEGLVYTVPETEHWDGYHGQPFVLGDDLVKVNDARAVAMQISLITNTPVLLPQAHLEDKGTYLTSQVMISTTNVPYPVIKDILCMEAVYRRRHVLLEVECNPEVINTSTGKYDDALWKAKYSETERHKYPHLTFNFLKPIRNSTEPYESEQPGAVPRDAYYADDEVNLPLGLAVPLTDLSFDQITEKICARFRSMRAEEASILRLDKERVMTTQWSEIDHAIDTLYGGDPPSDYMYGWYQPIHMVPDLSPEVERVIREGPSTSTEATASDMVTQALDAMDALCSAPNDLAQETGLSDTERSAFLTLESERRRRERILQARGRGEPLPTPPEYGHVTRIHTGDDVTRCLKMADNYRGRLTPRRLFPRGMQNGWVKKPFEEIASYIRGKIFQWNGDRWHSRRSRCLPYASDNELSARLDRTFEIKFLRNCVFHEGAWYYRLDGNYYAEWEHENFKKAVRACLNSQAIRDLEKASKLYREYISGEPVESTYIENSMLRFEDFSTYLVVDPDDPTLMRLVAEEDFLLADDYFLDQMYRFRNELTGFQQRDMVEKAKETWATLGELISEKIPLVKRTMSWIDSKLVKYRELGFYLWKKFMGQFPWIMTLFYCVMIVKFIRKLGDAFTDKAQDTSRVMFKGRGIRHMTHPQSTAVGVQNFQDMTTSLFRRNVCLCSVDDKQFSGVRSGYYLYTAYHCVSHAIGKPEFLLQIYPTPYSSVGMLMRVPWKHVAKIDAADLCVIYLPMLGSARDIDHLFLMQGEMTQIPSCPVVQIFYESPNQATIVERKPISVQAKTRVETWDGVDEIRTNLLEINEPLALGSSGAPVISSDILRNGARCMLGLQTINWKGRAFIQLMSQEMISAAKDRIQKEDVEVVMQEPDIQNCGRPIYEKYVNSHLDVVGKVNTDEMAGVLGTTKIVATPIAGAFCSSSVPAVLSKSDGRVNFASDDHPLKHSVNKFGRGQMHPLPSDLVKEAVESVSTYMNHALQYPKLECYDFVTSVQGTDHEGSGRFELDTSPGLPRVLDKYQGKKKGKRAYLDRNELGELTHIDPEFKAEFEEVDTQIRQLYVPATIMYEFPKDELRPRDKALGIGGPVKTRSVTVMSMTFALLFRRYHLALTEQMHARARGDFQCCVGVNPEGPSWHRMYQELMKHGGNNVFDFDVSNWDGHMTAELFFAVTKVVNRLYRGTEGDDNARFSLAAQALFGYDQWGDMLFKKLKGMPSGFGGTASYNSIGHMILFYVWWSELAREAKLPELMNFTCYLNCVTVYFYGDDVVFSISDKVISWFNPLTIKGKYTKYGWPVTTANKLARECVATSGIWNTQFLKRKFQPDEVYGTALVRPQIDEEVLMNLLVWIRANSRVSQLEQLQDNIVSALEFAEVRGGLYFRNLVDNINKQLALHGYPMVFVTYNSMRRSQMHNAYGVD